MRRELTTVKAVCPHDCPDTCGMVVTVDRCDRPGGRTARRQGPPVHARLPLPEGRQLPRPRLPPGPAAVPAAARRPEGRREVRAHLVGGRRFATIAARFREIAASRARPAGDPAVQLRRHDGQAHVRQPRPAVLPPPRRVPARPHDLRDGRRGGLRRHARHAGGDRPRGGGQLPVHRQLGLEHRRHQHPPLGDRARGPQARREDRHHRPVQQPDGGEVRLVDPDPPRHRRGPRARRHARHLPRGLAGRRLPRPLTASARRSSASGC